MKKFLTIAIGVLFMAYSSANAQSSKRSNIDYTSLGPIAGFGHSWLSGMDNQDFKPSIQLGIGMIYSKYEHLGIGADFSVSHEGYRMENELTNTEWTVNPLYLRLTPKLYYFFGEYGALVRPKIYAGPSVAYKIDERVSLNEENLSNEETGNDIFNDADLGLTAGAGVNIKIANRTWLNLDGSYYHGLIDVTDNGNANRNLKINVGVLFGL